MTAEEWDDLTNLLAIVEKAVNEACEFVAYHMEGEIKAKVCRLGVTEVEDVYQDVLLDLRRKLCQLRNLELFEAWLRRLLHSAAKKSRRRRARYSKPPLDVGQTPEKPKELDPKTTMIDGAERLVRVFEPNVTEVSSAPPIPFFEASSDSDVESRSKANSPNHIRGIDVRTAMAKLPKRWAKALSLRYVEGRSASEATRILGCTVNRFNNILQNAKQRMRELMRGYTRHRPTREGQVLELAAGCEVEYFPHFLQRAEAGAWLSTLLAEVPFQPEQLELYGKHFVLKRQTAQFGNNYNYDQGVQKSHPWPPFLTELKVLVEAVAGMQFDSALCNLYGDGEAYIGWHHDAGHPQLIASLSLGAVRELWFAETGSSKAMFGMELGHGSLLLIPEL